MGNMTQTKQWKEEPVLINENMLLNMRFLAWVTEKGDPIWQRGYIERNPRAYWDATEVYVLSIHCKENCHGDYYLHLSRIGNTDEFFCFLINGKWSQTFIHLRHITYFHELQEIVWALTRCNLFASEYLLNEYVKSLKTKS